MFSVPRKDDAHFEQVSSFLLVWFHLREDLRHSGVCSCFLNLGSLRFLEPRQLASRFCFVFASRFLELRQFFDQNAARFIIAEGCFRSERRICFGPNGALVRLERWGEVRRKNKQLGKSPLSPESCLLVTRVMQKMGQKGRRRLLGLPAAFWPDLVARAATQPTPGTRRV